MTAAPIRVGIVGANATRGWAKDAHVPALRHLPAAYTLAAVSARSQELAEQARIAFDAPRAFGDSLALAGDPEIDLVVVAVKVPEHRAVVLAALAAGKHVYCEWPLGRDVAEAEEMAAAVGPASHVMIGLQGLSAPAIRHAVDLVHGGAIGRPMVMRVFSPTAGWGAEAPPAYVYLQDKRNGATLETITGGHTLAVIEALAGVYIEADVRNSILRKQVRVSGTDEVVERTCADHMVVVGRHGGGCISTLEVVSGTADKPFVLEVEGERGWIRISGRNPGGFQTGALLLETSVAGERQPEPVVAELVGPPLNLAEGYSRLAADIRTGTRMVPDFTVAVGLSRLLDGLTLASSSGQRQSLAAAG